MSFRTESVKKFEQIEAQIKAGVPTIRALKKVGLASNTYYTIKRSLAKKKKTERKKTEKHAPTTRAELSVNVIRSIARNFALNNDERVRLINAYLN